MTNENTEHHILLLSELENLMSFSDIYLASDGSRAQVHSAILRNCSGYVKELLVSSASNLIILPGFSSVLDDFVSLVYTGIATNLGKKKAALLTLLCHLLGITTTVKEGRIDNLKIETKVFCGDSNDNFSLRFPKSRIYQGEEKEIGFPESNEILTGFKKRIYEEYNSSPVGPYEGPYDQHPQIPLNAQLWKSKLDYDTYTNFSHSKKMHCKRFRIKTHSDDIDDLRKIDTIEVDKDSNEVFIKPNDEKREYYTCSEKYCVIPCPCDPCNSKQGQCPTHNLKHPELFDEAHHAISIRSTDYMCNDLSFFRNCYVLKYPGIPKSCSQCKTDLLHHKSYHLVFHASCKFCKFYQYKTFPKTAEKLRARESEERLWYKKVCPYCDKKFVESYQRKKHIEMEHMNQKLKCDE